MTRSVAIGDRVIGDGQPVFVCAEIGINHNGSLDIAKQLIDSACRSGCDAVKFQKRQPDKCTPLHERDRIRETCWGPMTYLEYRKRVEFGPWEYQEIDRYCRQKKIVWFASVWDEESVAFMEAFAPPAYKIPSAALTDTALLRRARATGRPIILSTGMSSMEQVRAAIGVLGHDDLIVAHCTSTYPCSPGELNLRVIETLRAEFPSVPIGYSGHEVGLVTSVVAAALGASFVERHITLDRAMWGSDQAASIEPGGLERLVRYMRTMEASLGDGKKRVYPSEYPVMRRLRRVDPSSIALAGLDGSVAVEPAQNDVAVIGPVPSRG